MRWRWRQHGSRFPPIPPPWTAPGRAQRVHRHGGVGGALLARRIRPAGRARSHGRHPTGAACAVHTRWLGVRGRQPPTSAAGAEEGQRGRGAARASLLAAGGGALAPPPRFPSSRRGGARLFPHGSLAHASGGGAPARLPARGAGAGWEVLARPPPPPGWLHRHGSAAPPRSSPPRAVGQLGGAAPRRRPIGWRRRAPAVSYQRQHPGRSKACPCPAYTMEKRASRGGGARRAGGGVRRRGY